MNHSISLHFWEERNDVRSALLSAAFLASIKRGAHFIFEANPEVYYKAGISPRKYRRELTYQLRKMTLGISVGLVKENPTLKYHFDPYSHFSPDHEVRKKSVRNEKLKDEEDLIFNYKICEIRPPSIEKFLDSDGFSLDAAAPALTLPGEVSAPFDSRNTMFGREALWSVLLFPKTEGDDSEAENDNYIIRTILAQTILGEIGGSTKYSVAKTPTSVHVKQNTQFSEKVLAVLEFVQSWNCGTGSALICLNSLVKDLVESEIFDESNLDIIDMWTNDLLDVGYSDIPTLSDYDTEMAGPCIGDDALPGVYFHPSIQQRNPRSRTPKTLSFDYENPKPLSVTQLNQQISAKSIEKLCPTVDLDKQGICEDCDKHSNLLLIVTFNNQEYDSIPLFEVIYKHHFQNVIYCGKPNEKVEQYLEQYNSIKGTHFSFMPTYSKTGYECLLGAIEMGYNVNGYLLITHDALINSWNFDDLNPRTIWHGNQHARNISSDNIHELDPDNTKIMRSTLGILKAFEFLEEVLLKGPPAETMEKHKHMDDLAKKRRMRRSDEEVDSLDLLYQETDYEDGYEEEEVSEEDSEEMEKKGDIISVADNGNETAHMLFKKNWHISLFGEIIQDDETDSDPNLEENLHPIITNHHEMGHVDHINITKQIALKAYRNVTELLFHPANFHKDHKSNFEPLTRISTTLNDTSDHFEDMMFNIHTIYKSIMAKLNFWHGLVKNGRKHQTESDSTMLKKDLEHFQCDISTNSEICHLVSSFFNTLESNEGSNFRLFYDDLPIYYVPAEHKDKLYLMANLFTKYHIFDELAFPLLLRGLSPTEGWTDLILADMPSDKESNRPIVDQPQDLLLFEDVLEERSSALNELESAHYIYPVNMISVLKNEAMRDVICRNF